MAVAGNNFYKSHIHNKCVSNFNHTSSGNSIMGESADGDRDLTDLSWLLNLDISKLPASTPIENKFGNACMNRPSEFEVRSPFTKPNFSYSTLICMAMKESDDNKVSLSDIYKWITDRFPYYRVANPSWQNSIRHNLSLNKCFEKVPRRRDEPGKGGFWRLNKEYTSAVVDGILKPQKCVHESSSQSESAIAAQYISNMHKQEPNTHYDFPNGVAYEETYPAQDSKVINMENAMTDDYNLTALMNQDIEIGEDFYVRTKDLIDTEKMVYANQVARPITDFSPPPSISNSENGVDEACNIENDTDRITLTNVDQNSYVDNQYQHHDGHLWYNTYDEAFVDVYSSPDFSPNFLTDNRTNVIPPVSKSVDLPSFDSSFSFASLMKMESPFVKTEGHFIKNEPSVQ